MKITSKFYIIHVNIFVGCNLHTENNIQLHTFINLRYSVLPPFIRFSAFYSCLQEKCQQDSQSVEPDIQIDDADDQSEVGLSECEDDGCGSDSDVEGDVEGEADEEEKEPLQSSEASPVSYMGDEYVAPSQPCGDTQPSSPVPIKDVIEIPDTPSKTMENGNQEPDGSDGGEYVKNTHMRNRAELEEHINALTFKLNNAKKMYASKCFGFNMF